VLFSCRPHLSSTTGDSGKTTFIIIITYEDEKDEIEMKMKREKKENEKMLFFIDICLYNSLINDIFCLGKQAIGKYSKVGYERRITFIYVYQYRK
jgi:glycosylphosphatidylinositol transamidase (GPIT) subunit GPI8